MTIGPEPRIRIVSRSSRRGTSVPEDGAAEPRRTYASLLFPDSLRIAVSRTVAKPPQTNPITTIIVIQVLVVIGVSFARRRPDGGLLERSATVYVSELRSEKRPA